MRKRVIICIVLCLVAVSIGVGVIYASVSGDSYFLAGELFRSAQNKAEVSTNGNVKVVAKYNGEEILSSVVEYYKSLHNLGKTEEEYVTDTEIIHSIIENLMMVEEAQRQGCGATQTEIDNMVANTVRAYSIPEGKEMLDSYLKGVGITFDEYLEIVKEQAPRVIARQKLIDAVGRKYCEENGMEFTKVNPPAEMVAAQEAYIANLFDQNKHKIEYLVDVPVVS